MSQSICDFVVLQLSAMLDSELDTDTFHLVQVHLGQCEACCALLKELEMLDGQLAEAWSADLHVTRQQAADAADAVLLALPPLPCRGAYAAKRVHHKTRWNRLISGIS